MKTETLSPANDKLLIRTLGSVTADVAFAILGSDAARLPMAPAVEQFIRRCQVNCDDYYDGATATNRDYLRYARASFQQLITMIDEALAE